MVIDNGLKIPYAYRGMMNTDLLSKKPIIVILVVAVLALAVVPSVYFYTKYQKSQMLLKNPTEAAKEEVKALTARVGTLIELPNEEPTVATVSDKEKLADQPFFAKSENGDKVLIYPQSKKAILYRPSIGKVIEVSTLNVSPEGNASPAATPSAETSPISVILYNGTATVGLTANVEKKIKNDPELGKKISVINKENAVKKDYAKTIVVVLNAAFSAEGEQMAKLLGGTVSPLPEGEARPATDIAVFIGK